MASRGGYKPRQRIAPTVNGNHNTARRQPITATLNTRIRDYVKDTRASSDGPSFVNQREIPTSDEISAPLDGRDFEIQVNRVAGRWESREQYLTDHYALLREDGVSSLRAVVDEFRVQPHLLEKDSKENAQIYEKVG